jgi:carbon starvation protein
MGRARYIWVTLAPLAWLIAVTFSASWHKIFDANPQIGFLAHARQLAAGPASADLARRIFNDRLDAAVCAVLIVLISAIFIESALAWVSVISGRRAAATQETPFVTTSYATEEIA